MEQTRYTAGFATTTNYLLFLRNLPIREVAQRIDEVIFWKSGHDRCPVCHVYTNTCTEHSGRNPQCEVCWLENTPYATAYNELLTPCGHFFHRPCIVLWLSFCKATRQPLVCPGCPGHHIQRITWLGHYIRGDTTFFVVPRDLPGMSPYQGLWGIFSLI
jgi:hypothetical protein